MPRLRILPCLPAIALTSLAGIALPSRGADTTLKEVTVTAGSAGDVAERRQSATQKIVIERPEIEAMGALTISDVMGKLPGVDAGTAGADGAMNLRSRGMVRDSVQILVDGERVHANARVAQGIVGRLPSTELLRVEITRGSSAEVGGNAPVSVNLILARPLSRESTALKFAVGSREGQPLVQTSFTKGGGDKGFSWLLPVTLNHHEMPAQRAISRGDSTGVNQSDREDGDRRTEEFVVSPRLTWKSGADNLNLAPVFFRSYGRGASEYLREDIGTPANSSTRRDNEKSQNVFNRLRADGEMLRQGIKYSGRLAFSDGYRHADARRNGLTLAGTVSSSQEQMRRHERDHSAALRLDWSAVTHVLAAGFEQVDHRRDESQTNGALAAAESHSGRDRQRSLWLQDEWSTATGLTLTGGLRGEVVRYEIDGLAQDHGRLLPSLALRWEPAKQWVARGSLGAGFKPPALAELTNQPVFSVNANTPLEPDRRGNPNLHPERSVNLEAVLERYLPNDAGVFGVNAYLRHTDDFTERRVQLEGARWVDRPYNEGSARHWGLELDGKLRTDTYGWRGATLRAHLTLPRSRVDDTRLGLTRPARETPRYLLSGGYDQTLGERSFGLSFQHSGRVLTEVAGEQNFETRRRTVLDVYALQKLDAAFNLRLSLQNLLRADTQRHQEAFAAPAWWSLATNERGLRTALLSLEGKW